MVDECVALDCIAAWELLQMKGEHWSGVGEIPGLDTTQIIYLDIVPIE
jgi:hypothetical protein